MNSNALLRFVAPFIVASALLCACAQQRSTVVLLPEQDGRATAVTVKTGDQQMVLDKPYAAVRQATFGPLPYASTQQEVDTLFAAALGAQPLRPVEFRLYFVEGSDDLTAESLTVVDGIFASIATRSVPDILIVGHTDAVGSDAFNDELSRKRAEVVRGGLIKRGIATENIVVVGRGKRELLVPTPDGVAEARNRRVEIFVR